MRGNTICLDSLGKHFGSTAVIQNLSAEIDSGEFIVILGPSGCGKSTMLNMIAGLETVSHGRIFFGSREVQNEEPKNRGCAMVFQNYALYPHMTVGDNIGYALKVAGVKKTERAQRVAEAAKTVELGDYLERRPSQLSGGQRQRVAIARAIVREPEVLLFDEPLSNLDAKLRHGMRMELSQLHKRIGATSIFVTHDQVEAMTLADRVMILNGGKIEQFAAPREIYHQPATVFVAGFIGAPSMNLFNVFGDGTALRLNDGTELVRHTHRGPAILGIRPEKLDLNDGDIPASVIYREDLGSHTALVARLPNGTDIDVATAIGAEVTIDDSITVGFPDNQIHLFNTETGQRLPA